LRGSRVRRPLFDIFGRQAALRQDLCRGRGRLRPALRRRAQPQPVARPSSAATARASGGRSCLTGEPHHRDRDHAGGRARSPRQFAQLCGAPRSRRKNMTRNFSMVRRRIARAEARRDAGAGPAADGRDRQAHRRSPIQTSKKGWSVAGVESNADSLVGSSVAVPSNCCWPRSGWLLLSRARTSRISVFKRACPRTATGRDSAPSLCASRGRCSPGS